MSMIARHVNTARLAASCLVIVALWLTLTDTSGLVPERIIDLLGYYTLQANVLAVAVWVILAVAARRRVSSRVDRALEYARAFATANLILVAVIYWSAIAPLGLQSGPRLVGVMVISHIITPVFASMDYLLVGAATPLPLRGWWWFFAIPTVWMAIAIARAYAGGWVPYDFLDPARGLRAIAGTVSWHGVILAALTVVALRLRALRSVPHAWGAAAVVEAAPDVAAPLDNVRF